MIRITVLPLSVALLLTICLPGGAQQVQISSKPNPQIEKILGEISAANIEAIMRKLVGFGTRHTMSPQDDPARGIGAAWRRRHAPRLATRIERPCLCRQRAL